MVQKQKNLFTRKVIFTHCSAQHMCIKTIKKVDKNVMAQINKPEYYSIVHLRCLLSSEEVVLELEDPLSRVLSDP